MQTIIVSPPRRQLARANGSYAHALKDIAFDSNNKLYVSIGSSCKCVHQRPDGQSGARNDLSV